MPMIRLVLIDDHPLMLEGLEQLLRLDPDFAVVAKCQSVAEGLRAIDSLHPHVVVLDLKLRDEEGLQVLTEIKAKNGPAVVVLTASENDEDLLEAVRLGARGVVLKAMAPKTLEHCIRSVYGGRDWLVVDGDDLGERIERRRMVERQLAERLTPRELEIVRSLVRQLDNDEIAQSLGLSVGTVKIHVHHVYSKLGVNGREGLLDYLLKKGY
jgi:DNA-binding NarL/FixJ family response regulator